MFFVYVLHSVTFDRYYVGVTSNLEQRLNKHNSGHVKSTKAFVPWMVVLNENFNSREEARKRELYLKSAAGRRWRKQYLASPPKP
jgi:putative endonuclease